MITFDYFRHLIRIGDTNLTSENDNKYAIDLAILDSFVHPNYDTVRSYYDVAIFETASVEFSERIRPICLPGIPSNDIHKYDNDHVELTGWGKKNLHSDVSEKLKRVSLKIFSLR